MMNRRHPPLEKVYDRLYRAWGPQGWWPGRTRLEIAVGAILTQNTAWSNVEKAIASLRKAKALNLKRIHEAKPETLAGWIRPAGYFRVKARRLQSFTSMVFDRYEGSLDRLFRLETDSLRSELLAVNGIGKETADSILLYAGRRPVFVVDAYTYRFMRRHGWIHGKETYDEIASIFVRALPRDVQLYNEYHALIVALGKDLCKTVPRCEACPLRGLLPPGGVAT